MESKPLLQDPQPPPMSQPPPPPYQAAPQGYNQPPPPMNPAMVPPSNYPPPQHPGYPPPQQPGYPPPQHAPPAAYGTGIPPPPRPTVVIQQAPPRPVLSNYQLRDIPAQIRCPTCHRDVVTVLNYEAGLLAWLLVGVLFFFGFFLCCWIPLVLDACKDVVHTCPHCHATCGMYKRM